MPDTRASDNVRFVAFLECVESQMPPDLWQQTASGLARRYDTPPLAELEACLHRNVTLDKARELLFYPTDEDMALYPLLVANPPNGASESHPQFKVQVVALSSLYLVHSRDWKLLRAFIEAGGLRALVDACASSNLYLASQAMQVLLCSTSEEMYPWHDPPTTPDGKDVKTGPDALLWRNMFELSRSPLLPNLLRHQPDTFPGSALLALRIFAFYVSWLRYHFTQERVLRLSQPLLDLLKEWSGRSGASPEEHTMAQQLYTDFSRFPAAEAVASSTGGGASWDMSGVDHEWADVKVVYDKTQVNSASSDNEAESLKQQGNAFYKAGDWTSAIRLYSSALDSLVPAARLAEPGESSRRAVYHVNRAAAYLARAEAGGGRLDDVDSNGLMEGCELGNAAAITRHYHAAILDCNQALDLDPSYTKAHLRKCQALIALGDMTAARDACEVGVKASNGVVRSELEQLRSKITVKNADPPNRVSGASIDQKTSSSTSSSGSSRPAAGQASSPSGAQSTSPSAPDCKQPTPPVGAAVEPASTPALKPAARSASQQDAAAARMKAAMTDMINAMVDMVADIATPPPTHASRAPASPSQPAGDGGNGVASTAGDPSVSSENLATSLGATSRESVSNPQLLPAQVSCDSIGPTLQSGDVVKSDCSMQDDEGVAYDMEEMD